MKFITLSCLVALLLTTLPFSAFAQKPTGGAKDLFYAQLSHPAEQLNNGVQYWIELKRGNTTSHVSNKHNFRSGDEIRFHVRPNTHAYAYILLSEGSCGERSLLFPAPGHVDNNRLAANSECAIPSDGFIVFDSHPGNEKVTVLLARKPLDPNQYLQQKRNETVVIASAISGSKDLVPGSCVVSMAPPPETKPTPAAVDEHVDQAGTITVVQRNPDEVLALDIILTHQP